MCVYDKIKYSCFVYFFICLKLNRIKPNFISFEQKFIDLWNMNMVLQKSHNSSVH